MGNPQDRKVVFVVDDEHIIASTLTMILQSKGFDVTSFTDSLEALRAAHFGAPDLLVSDVAMPFLSGFKLAARIKAFCPDCRVLLFSAEATLMDHLMNDSEMQEGFAILPKPVHPAVLLETIQELLGSPSVAAAAPY